MTDPNEVDLGPNVSEIEVSASHLVRLISTYEWTDPSVPEDDPLRSMFMWGRERVNRIVVDTATLTTIRLQFVDSRSTRHVATMRPDAAADLPPKVLELVAEHDAKVAEIEAVMHP